MSGLGKGSPDPSNIIQIACPSIILLKQVLFELKEIKKQLASNNMAGSDLLTNDELMLKYKVSRSTAINWRSKGMPYSKAGGKLYYKRSEVEQFINREKRRGF